MFKNSGITPGNDSTGKVYAVHNICQQPFFTTVHPCLYSVFRTRIVHSRVHAPEYRKQNSRFLAANRGGRNRVHTQAWGIVFEVNEA